MSTYYNEFDPKTAAWLRELIKAGLIPPGDVDERSISDVKADDVRGYTACHFFAGIGGWAYALQLAGWPQERPVWTGSCPCQPFSVGNVFSSGMQDPRHLWPAWFRIIRECQPATIIGEQVPAAIEKGWLDQVFTDLESIDHACGAAIIPGYISGARHFRKRLFWISHTGGPRRERHKPISDLPVAASAALPVDGDPLARAWGALDGNYRDLLPCDGLSVQLERDAIKGYGNAIVPQVAAEFIRAYLETLDELPH